MMNILKLSWIRKQIFNNMLEALKSSLFRKYKSNETCDHKLKYLFLEVTRKCNLACIHCGSDCSRDFSMSEMTTESWISIIDYMYELYNPFFVITGGEPLVCDGLFEITAHLKSKNASWGMVTNGMTLEDSVLKRLVNDGLESITLSLDGDEKSHKYIRRAPESWDRAVGALKLIGSSKVKTKDVVTCVYPGNLYSLEETAELLINKGIKNWRLFRIFPKGAAKNNKNLHLSFKESQYLIDWIKENRPAFIKKGLKIDFSCEGYLPLSLDREVRDEPYFCKAGINIASILCDGTITGCNNNGPDYYQGNLTKDDFHSVWENGFKEFRDKDWLKTGKCTECKEWKNCLGGSIHLRDKGVNGPNFCYIHDIETNK